MDGLLDEWIIGFEFKIRITKKDGKRDSERGILDFSHMMFFCISL